MFDRLKGQVNVQVRPVEMPWSGKFDVHDGIDCCMAEPRELLERYE